MVQWAAMIRSSVQRHLSALSCFVRPTQEFMKCTVGRDDAGGLWKCVLVSMQLHSHPGYLHMITCARFCSSMCVRACSVFTLWDFVLWKVCQAVSWERRKTRSEAGCCVRIGTKRERKHAALGNRRHTEKKWLQKKWRRHAVQVCLKPVPDVCAWQIFQTWQEKAGLG